MLSYRTSSEITQFKDGMNDVGDMLGLITKNADAFKPLFCHLSKDLSKREMDNIIRYDYSGRGSNSWELLRRITIFDSDHPASMGELLAFMSGASTIPPCGFHKPIDIHFYTQEDGMTRLPSVSTCSLEMWLPRGQGPETLSALLMRCLQESQGFLKI
ncbi:uncharacterized protein LOC128224423 [Mya arenaria]|uniref:uncharacterized protein LOC128224423 n=1 Tax=Mya arenaria TaxID=6604 RepID=UPI0022E04AB6|nr:uncharacterized protein LOC128224423 [Mya arenaria]